MLTTQTYLFFQSIFLYHQQLHLNEISHDFRIIIEKLNKSMEVIDTVFQIIHDQKMALLVYYSFSFHQ